MVLHSHLLLTVVKLLEFVRGGERGWGINGKRLFRVLSVTLILTHHLFQHRLMKNRNGSKQKSRMKPCSSPPHPIISSHSTNLETSQEYLDRHETSRILFHAKIYFEQCF